MGDLLEWNHVHADLRLARPYQLLGLDFLDLQVIHCQRIQPVTALVRVDQVVRDHRVETQRTNLHPVSPQNQEVIFSMLTDFIRTTLQHWPHDLQDLIRSIFHLFSGATMLPGRRFAIKLEMIYRYVESFTSLQAHADPDQLSSHRIDRSRLRIKSKTWSSTQAFDEFVQVLLGSNRFIHHLDSFRTHDGGLVIEILEQVAEFQLGEQVMNLLTGPRTI
ncbi:hypothetical protein BMS3Bbin04_00571 [bacterium BMS3Bbin04]|nr:hypothetical protein BMS3Bbin04_00571 [bacterium BMS3Bbin04]